MRNVCRECQEAILLSRIAIAFTVGNGVSLRVFYIGKDKKTNYYYTWRQVKGIYVDPLIVIPYHIWVSERVSESLVQNVH